jgi:hypothetical protein
VYLHIRMYVCHVWTACVVHVCVLVWVYDVVKARRTHVAGPPSWVKDMGMLYRRRVVVEDPLLLAARVPPAGGGGAHHGEVVVVLHGLVDGDDCFRRERGEVKKRMILSGDIQPEASAMISQFFFARLKKPKNSRVHRGQ